MVQLHMKKLLYFIALIPVLAYAQTEPINPESITVNSEYTFPTADGTNGQALVTNGSGTVTFADVSVDSILFDEVHNGLISPRTTILSIDADNTKFDVAAGAGVLNGDYFTWTAKNAVAVTDIGTTTFTHIYIESDGDVYQSKVSPTPVLRRQYLYIGQLGHTAGTIANAINAPDVWQGPDDQYRDLLRCIGIFSCEGNIVSANGANLSINISAGELFGAGINFATDPNNPNEVTRTAQTAPTFRRRTQTGLGTSSTTLDVGNYDVGGVITSLSGTKYTNQRVYLLTNGNVIVQYGQNQYNSMSLAVSSIGSETFVELGNIKEIGALVGVISVRSTATDLTNSDQAVFSTTTKLGQSSNSAGYLVLNSGDNRVVTDNGDRTGNAEANLTFNGSTLDLTGVFDLDNTTTSTTGVITKGGTRFIHNYKNPTGGGAIPQGFNLFIGVGAGNFTMGSTATSTSESSQNIGIGDQSLSAITTGYRNLSIGYNSNPGNTTGHSNTAIGATSLTSNTTGSGNVAVGTRSLESSTTLSNNTAIGYMSAHNLSTGANNLAIGYQAGRYVSSGTTSLTNINNSILIGYDVRANADSQSNQIVIGYEAIGNGSNTTTIGNSSTIGTYINGALVSPRIRNFLLDSLGAKYFRFSPTASAVNYLTFANAAMGNNPTFTATGSDPNIGINYTTKGTGSHVFTGNVGIGTTPSHLLHAVKNQNTSSNIVVENIDVTNSTSRAQLQAINGTVQGGIISIGSLGEVYVGSTSSHVLNLMTGGSTRIAVSSSGNVTMTGTLGITGTRVSNIYTTNQTTTNAETVDSDSTLKTNIHPIPNATDKVKKLNPVEYTWKADTLNKIHYGLIAQEVNQVIPDIISIRENENSTQTMGVAYTELIPYLIKTIQELDARITELEGQ